MLSHLNINQSTKSSLIRTTFDTNAGGLPEYEKVRKQDKLV